VKALVTQLLRFAAVGGVGFVVDVAVFNILRVTVFSPEQLHEGPVLAKVASTSVAILVNWLGNRYWTFGPHRRPQALREGLEFVLVSIGGMAIGLACLWVSHYLLGFTSLLADNISSNVVGLALGTAFRFWLYRTWVFRPRMAAQAKTVPSPAAGALPTGPVPTIPAVD
jgi:putative flippase GtrA